VKLNETVTEIFSRLHDLSVDGKVSSGVTSGDEYSGGMVWIF